MDDLSALDRNNIWHPFTPLEGVDDPLLIRSASGVNLYTADGRTIIDAVSSWWVNLHGHSNPHIAAAVASQALTLEHVIFAGFTHEPAIRLSQNLLQILPRGMKKIFYSDNGSTAVEVALKMAFQYWHNRGIRKTNVIAIEGAYHGDTFGAMSVASRSLFTKPFLPYLFQSSFINFPETGNGDAVLQSFRKIVKGGDVAAFIFEPLVQGAAGMRMYAPAVLDEMLHIARAHDVLCIADEVFTGFGRTGKHFAVDYLQQQPDIIAVSKGITGGTMPLGATACNEKVQDAFLSADLSKTFFHGHSYTANPIACAAANASFELLMQPACQQRIAAIARSHQHFAARIRPHTKVSNVRTLGTILAITLDSGEDTDYGNSMRKEIYPYFLSRDILLRPLGNVIYVLPPYVMSQEDLAKVYHAIMSFLDR